MTGNAENARIKYAYTARIEFLPNTLPINHCLTAMQAESDFILSY